MSYSNSSSLSSNGTNVVIVKRVCYADDLTVWATAVKIPDLEDSVNSYLEEIIAYKHQFQMHPDITLEDTQLPLERSPKILGVIMDPSISFHKH